MSPPSKVVEAALEKNWKFVLEIPSGATSSFISGDCLEALRMVVTSDRTGRFLDKKSHPNLSQPSAPMELADVAREA